MRISTASPTIIVSSAVHVYEYVHVHVMCNDEYEMTLILINHMP